MAAPSDKPSVVSSPSIRSTCPRLTFATDHVQALGWTGLRARMRPGGLSRGRCRDRTPERRVRLDTGFHGRR
ncbi:MAG: hypothetical protein MZV64_02710 [Ignavibacteriales bacterium]|nr:hypothetical protein [Ignavibacteriales bacterium]